MTEQLTVIQYFLPLIIGGIGAVAIVAFQCVTDILDAREGN